MTKKQEYLISLS